jgi:glycosyltransferase involved in cell wall biosynthesis
MPPAVSVICTFLNAEDTLEATLASLQGQTTGEARFVLVDDHSTDDSAAIAGRFCAADRRFSLHDTPEPGRGYALNLGVAKSESEFLAVLDADDLAHPAWLEDGLAAMRRRPEFAVIGFERIYIRDDEPAVWTSAGEVEVRDVTRGLARANVLAHSGVIMRRSWLAELGGYDAERQSLFDYDLWIRFAQAGRPLGLSALIRIAKRYHEGQKFARSRGYSFAAWRDQLRAIMVIDRNYRNFLRLGLRVAGDITRRPRRALASGMKRR